MASTTMYDPSKHTYESLQHQFSDIEKYGGLIVGSLGRTAYLGYQEFLDRGEHPLYTADGRARDIDTVNYTKNGNESPFDIDTAAFASRDVRLSRLGGTWILSNSYYNYHVELDEEVMEPKEVTFLNGIKGRTFNNAVHLNLLSMYGVLRPNDIRARRLLMLAMSVEEIRIADSDKFEPFNYLRRLNAGNPARNGNLA